ncbi:MAG: TonB family protein [Gammaproteobacteria bacterium]|nr:TonB family protein [Gammaproteobacteria bacterium]
MAMSGERRLMGIAMVVSVLMHGLVLFVVSTDVVIRAKAQERKAEQAIRVSFSMPRRAIEPESEPESEPVAEIKPKPIPKPESKPEPKPRPKPKPKPKPRPESKAAPQVKPPPVTQPTVTQPPSTPAAPDLAVLKAAYVSRLLERIEAHKQYPRAARRRGIQGRIRVSLQVLANGNIKGLRLEGGHKLLRRAARRAIEQALPLPPPPSEFGSRFALAYAMEFKIK